MNVAHNETYKGVEVNIYYDECPQSPREDCNLGTIAGKHHNYKLGEEQISDPIEWLEGMLNLEAQYEYNNERLFQLEALFAEKYIGLKIYMYEHGQVALSTRSFVGRAHHGEWDSGQVGYIYMTLDKAREEYSAKRISQKLRTRLEGYLSNEVETYGKYINGEVYGYVVKSDSLDLDDSCWGYYEEDYCIEEAKSVIDYCIKKARKDHFKKVKDWIKSKVPFIYRQSLQLI